MTLNITIRSLNQGYILRWKDTSDGDCFPQGKELAIRDDYLPLEDEVRTIVRTWKEEHDAPTT